MNNRHLYGLVFVLMAAGLGLFFFKVTVLGFPVTPFEESEIWDVEASVSFVAQKKPVRFSLFLPRNTERTSIVNEQFLSRGYGLITRNDDGNRQAVWSIRKDTGEQTLYYHATVQREGISSGRKIKKIPDVVAPGFEGPFLDAANSVVSEIVSESADMDILVAALLKKLNSDKPDDHVLLLLGKKNTLDKKLQTAVQILALHGSPARVAHGIRLKEQGRDLPFVHWLQVFDNGFWKNYHPLTFEPEIPEDYLFWWHGAAPVFTAKGVDNPKVKISVSLSLESAINALVDRGQVLTPQLIAFSLFSLPIHVQTTYRILLMIPVGALLLVFLRNIVGVKTFGTFTPVLIALAFRETELVWGLFFFSIMVALGLSVRFYLEHLKLLLVPRIASVLIVVVILMAVFSIITHKLGLVRGLSVAIFPMVILTMTIERMSIVWEERGPSEAMQQGFGSLLVASAAFAVMNIKMIEHVLFVFPEMLLVCLSGTLLIGRYTGYRLTELFRFKVFLKD